MPGTQFLSLGLPESQPWGMAQESDCNKPLGGCDAHQDPEPASIQSQHQV